VVAVVVGAVVVVVAEEEDLGVGAEHGGQDVGGAGQPAEWPGPIGWSPR
jgi:hypothetical protein